MNDLHPHVRLSAHEIGGHMAHAVYRQATRVTCTRDSTGWVLSDDVDLLKIQPLDHLPAVLFAGLASGCAGERALEFLAAGVHANLVPFKVADLWCNGGFWTALGEADRDNAADLIPCLPGGRALVLRELMGALPTVVGTLALMKATGLLQAGQHLAGMALDEVWELPVKVAQKAAVIANARRRMQ